MSDAAVVVEDLEIHYGSRVAVSGISWSAQAGQIVSVLGPNGAGKTSTIETLEGYRKPTAGHVRVLGCDPIADARRLSSRIGVMLQRNGVYLTMNPRDVLRLFAAYYEHRAVNPNELLQRIGLGPVATTPWRRLSGGEQQRLSLGLALVGRPEVLFLDEPTAMIDPAARTMVRDLIAEQRNNGCCVVLTTHDLDDAERLADRVIILDGGRVVADGSPEELTTATGTDGITFTTDSAIDVGLGTVALGAPVQVVGSISESAVGPGAHRYRVNLPASPQAIALLTNWLADQGRTAGTIQGGKRPLEEVFVKLTESAREATATSGTRPNRRRRSR